MPAGSGHATIRWSCVKRRTPAPRQRIRSRCRPISTPHAWSPAAACCNCSTSKTANCSKLERPRAWLAATNRPIACWPPRKRDAFNLELEPSFLRDRYGRNEYGESFLLARWLIEAEVKLVTVSWMYFMPNGRIANVWDTHGGTAGLGNASGFDMLRANYCIPPLDRAVQRFA